MLDTRILFALCIAAALVAGCKKQQEEAAAPEAEVATTSSEAATPPAGTAPAAAEPAQPQAAPAQAFDINAIAVSDKPLGEWPYIAAPAGYIFYDDTSEGTKDLARVAFWTGSQLLWVEGKTYETNIHAGEGKTFSKFEVLKGIDQALTALGAVKISGKGLDDVAYAANKDEVDAFVSEFGDVYGAYRGGSDNTVATYVIRRADKAIWAVVTSTNGNAGLLLADGPLPEAAPVQ